MYIKDIMTSEIVTVREDDTVEKCANLLITHNLSGLPVLDESGKVKGIVTEGDLIRRASRVKGPAALEVLGGIFYLESPKKFMDDLKKTMGNSAKDIMTKEVITVDPDKLIEEAATLLVQNKIKRLPVIDKEGNLIGIVSRKDIMNYLFMAR
jgi:CBS domain-containing protein